jgi:pyruvate dehydrogenase E2 component (dihydrolipoamide acetyltransferase)
MATAVFMSALSPTMTEGKIVKWKKKEGDPVKNAEIIAEVETDKAIMDLESPDDGVLLKIFVDAGTSVPVGGTIGAVGKAGEDVSGLAPARTKPVAMSPGSGNGSRAEPPSAAPASPVSAPAPVIAVPAATAPGARVRSSPLARRMARERGLDLSVLPGTGPGGRVVRRDIEQMLARGTTVTIPSLRSVAAPKPVLAPSLVPAARQAEAYEPLSSMRKSIATRMVQAKRDVPHFYLTMDVDMERATEMRAQLKELGTGATLTDIIVKAAGYALLRIPEVNTQLDGERLHKLSGVDVGVAVAIDGGLITPVIRDVDRKSIAQIAAEAEELAERARNRRLKPEEYTGGSITVSNLGMYGIDQFVAIISPPQSAILAIGAAADRPVVIEGEVVVRKRMWVTLSGDHRVIDGAIGARYLQELKSALERPLALMM